MKTNEIMKSVSLTFNKVGFRLQKKSPEILVAAGVVGIVVSAVKAWHSTTTSPARMSQSLCRPLPPGCKTSTASPRLTRCALRFMPTPLTAASRSI